MLSLNPAFGERKELWLINIKQAIQGLFTAGTSTIPPLAGHLKADDGLQTDHKDRKLGPGE